MKKIPTATLNIEETRRRATTNSRSNPMNRIRKTIMTQTSLLDSHPIKLTKLPIAKLTLGIASLAIGLGMGIASAATTFTDGSTSGTGIHLAANWSNGLPTGTNAGTVSTEFSTSYFNGFVADDYHITYNGASSLSGVNASIALAGGTSLTFNESSTFTVGGRLTIGSVGSADVILSGNASATVAERVIFGSADTTGASLSLGGNSSFTTSTNQVVLGGTGKNYNLTLSDSAIFEDNASSYGVNGNTLTVNFQQGNELFTPTWQIPSVRSFTTTFVQYQIDGVNTTLGDERFVVTEGVEGFNTLQLTVIPEPSSLLLLGIAGLAMTLVNRRRRA
jgi:hypothetical protein